MSRISWENYEEYMMMHADGELPEADERDLIAFIAQHPQLQSELDEYSAVRLLPDTTIVYANKQALLKEEPVAAAPRIIAFPAWKKYSIAAAVAAILFVSAYRIVTSSDEVANNAAIAGNVKQGSEVKAAEATVPVNSAPLPATPENNVAAAQPVNAANEQQQAALPVKRTQAAVKQEVMVAQQETKRSASVRAVVSTEEIREQATPVEQLPVASVKEIEAPPAATIAAAETLEVPAYAAIQEQPKETQSFLDRLPVDDIKKKQIGNIANAIKDATESKKWSVKIEKKKLVLSF